MSDSKDSRPNVVLICQNHMITGELRLGDVRLSDLLNDVHHSFIELDNAAFSRVSEPEKFIDRTPRTVVAKEKVVVAFETSANGVSPRRELNYRKKRQYPVFLATKDMEIRGMLHATLAHGVPDLCLIQDRWFVPVTNATITLCSVENRDLNQHAILVNVRDIQYFAVGDPVHPDK